MPITPLGRIQQCKHLAIKAISRFTSKHHKLLRQSRISFASIVVNALALWLCGDFDRPASAAPLYDTLTSFLVKSSNTFCTKAGMDCTAIIALINLIPWSAIFLVGAIVGWEAYRGYEAYNREDSSGLGKSVLNIVVTVALTLVSNFITNYISTAS